MSLILKMLLKYFVLTTAIKPIFCVYLANDVSTVSNIDADTDKTKTMCMHGFPDVIYPTSILDNQPFYFNVNGFDGDLGPFGKEVKSSYKDIIANNNKKKEINLTKNQDSNKIKLTPRANSSIYQDKYIANQECEKIISEQMNEKIIFNEINETGHNVNLFVQDNVPRDVSQISSKYLKNNNFNVIEECGTYNDSLFNTCDTVIAIENEAIDDNVKALARNETLNQICETKNTLFEKSMIDEHQQQPQNCSVEDILICEENQFIASNSTNNTFSTKSFSLTGESSKENEISSPFLHLFNNSILEDIC